MASGLLLDKINQRILIDKEEGDIAYFQALMLQFEYILKIITSCVLSCIRNDADRQRYSLEYNLVRANSLGKWVEILTTAIRGPSSQLIIDEALSIAHELIDRVSKDDWRFGVVARLSEICKDLRIEASIGQKITLAQYFEFGTSLRNRTKGHGAITGMQCNSICTKLSEANNLVLNNLTLFKFHFAYLYRNLSGKYRVTPLLGDCVQFSYLKRTKDESYTNGVYLFVDHPHKVEFIYSDPEVNDIFLPNGNYKNASFEMISYVTNEIKNVDQVSWITPTGHLPASQTEGRKVLDVNGYAFANLPPITTGIIKRSSLEEQLKNELLKIDQHPIITLTGPGGVGKTTIALNVIDQICNSPTMPFETILWLSARDIDLLETGPKVVQPRVIAKKDISVVAYNLLEPSDWKEEDCIAYFEKCLTTGAAGNTLFIFDNFETIVDPVDVYMWIDTFLRLPNKVLITTRIREFSGDIPIEVGGMDDDEALRLIEQESRKLGIEQLIAGEYKNSLINESDGHPYVIKILLGQIAQEQRQVKPERIIANSEHILTALFERTYESLRPASKRVFLLLCSWRVYVPVIAIEAVSLRPGNERFDVSSAIEQLIRFSLVDEIESKNDKSRFIGVPLAASLFGRNKLTASPYKIAVEEDRKILMEFGAGKKEDVSRGVIPRIQNLVKSVAFKASENPEALQEFLPILEYISTSEPKAFKYLAELILEADYSEVTIKRAIHYYRLYLENAEYGSKMEVWEKIADLSHAINDAVSVIHALTEAALLPSNGLDEIATFANKINNRIRDLKDLRIEQTRSFEVKKYIEKVAYKMAAYDKFLDATNCSRLSWLFLNIGDSQKAQEYALYGLEKDPENEHCLKLAAKLNI